MLAVAGTKEALFLIAQAIMPEAKADARPAVLLPNPLYNVYLGAAVMAGAEPVLLTASADDRPPPGSRRLEPGAAGAHRRPSTSARRPIRRALPPISTTSGARSSWRGATISS